MKRLKTYKLFNDSLQYLSDDGQNSNNEDYITLAHLLYDLFDEFEIVEWTNETFEHPDAPFNEDYPTHKFWSFRVFSPKGLENIKQSELDKDVKEITIWNIRDTDLGFKEKLDILIEESKEILGKDISVEAEVYADSPQEDLIDYTIKIK